MTHPLIDLVTILRSRNISQKVFAKAIGVTAPALSRAVALANAGRDGAVPLTWAYRLAQYAADVLPGKVGVALKCPATYAPAYYDPKWRCKPAAKAVPVAVEEQPR